MRAPLTSIRAALLATTALAGLAPAAAQQALPTQGSVASGSATISTSGSAMTVQQATPRAIINWNGFSIGQGNSVTFAQPNANSATLNRVTGPEASTIAGQLHANGQIYIVNPNGVAITPTGAVNVGGGFVASTLGITDRNFNEGRLKFQGGGASGSVSNAGTITTAPGGFVGLIGGTVVNSGVIDAPLGKVALGSGEQATLDLSGDGFLQVALPTNATTADGKALIDVSGKVSAAGGHIAIKAATAANAVRNAINLSGVASARSARKVGGSIVLGGGDGGDVAVSGKLDVSGRKGGALAVTGRNVALDGAKLIARGEAGKGGSVAVTGKGDVRLANASVDASGAKGGGRIAIGGGRGGKGPLGHAASVTIEASTLSADALAKGAGGEITVWSDGQTNVSGLLTARGGANGGNGGFVETSGSHADLNGASVDTSATRGLTGEWLIDPTDFTIGPGGDITGAQLSANLANTSVTIQSNDGASGAAGQIIVNDPVSWSAATTLTLDAFSDILVNNNISVLGAGGVALIYGDTTQTGAGTNAGALRFAMTDTGSTASLSFGAAGTLSINNTSYTLLRTESELVSNLNLPSAGPFALANDVTLATPYTTSAVSTLFTEFEGLGHTISGLNVTQGPASLDVGFFGVISSGASVSNLFLSGVNVNGGTANAVGALAGDNGGLVYNVGSSGTVSGSGSDIGGLVGNNSGLVNFGFSSAVVNGSATGGGNVGGLVGNNSGGVVNSFTSGDVTGDDIVGGLVGLNNGYVNGGSSGFIVGNSNVGGVVGQNNSGFDDFIFNGADFGPNGTVEGAYGYGGVFGTVRTGGIVGLNIGTTQFSFFNGTVGGETAVGGVAGSNVGQINNAYAINAVSGVTGVGGLVGVNTGSIDTSFAMGAVRGTTNVGGLVGEEGSDSGPSSITNSYSTGAVTGTTGVGGLVGALGPAASDTITNAYWDTLNSGQAASAGGQGATTAQLQGGAALPLGAGFAGGAAGGETNVYPYLLSFFPGGVRAVSGFAYTDAAGTTPLVSGANGAANVYVDTATSIKNPSNAGAHGYYYVFLDPKLFPTGAGTIAYTVLDTPTGSTNAATYLVSAGANNTTADILGRTLTETTPLATNTLLQQAVAATIPGDSAAAAAIAGVNFINIIGTGGGFQVDSAISTTASLSITTNPAATITISSPITAAALTINGSAATVGANVTTTGAGGVTFNAPITLTTSVVIDSGAGPTTFGSTVVGSAGLTVNGPLTLFGNVTTSGPILFNGPVNIAADVVMDAGASSITFASTLDSLVAGFNFTATAGALSFGGAIGDAALGNVTLTSVASMTLPSVFAQTLLATVTGAGNSLTLAPGTVINATGGGTAVVLSAAGAFINNAGPGAINLTGTSTPAPNWLIYSADPTQDVFGGLDSVNFAIWNTTYPASTPPTDGNHYLFAFQPTVTFTSTNDAKNYGEDVTARVATDYTVTGLQPAVIGAYLGDTAARAYTGTPSVTSAGSPANAGVVGSPYAIDVAQGTVAGINGYKPAFVSSGLLTVVPAEVTITAAPSAKTYDGTTTSPATPTITTGALFDAATLTETYSTPNAGTGLTLTPQIVFADPTVARNYLITLAPAATGTINPETITVVASPNTKTYDATIAAAAIPTVDGILYDAATLSETYATPNAGTGKTLNPSIVFANAAAAGNYNVILAPRDTGVINPEPITITATPTTKVFDGNTSSPAQPSLTAGTLFDAATLSQTFASPNPGVGIVLTPAIAFADPRVTTNYDITLVPTGTQPPNTGTILPRLFVPVSLSPSVFVDRPPEISIPDFATTCGLPPRLPDAASFSDPVAAIQAISTAMSQYCERCKDASQEDIANALERYADALEIIIQKLPPKLRVQLRQIPQMVRAAAVRARAAPTRQAAVRVLQQTVAAVHREIALVRAEDPDSARIRSAVNTGVSTVLNSAAVALARAEGI